MANSATLYSEAVNKAKDYVTAYNEHKLKKAELQGKKKAAMEMLENYNSQKEKETYLAWNAMGMPVFRACMSVFLPGILRFQFKENEDGVMTWKAVDVANRHVSLPMMQTTLGTKGVFNSPDWFDYVGTFATVVAEHTARRAGAAGFKYNARCAEAKFPMPEGVDILSDEGCVIALQTVIDKILFMDNGKDDGKNLMQAQLKNWVVIRESMTREAGIHGFAICNTAHFSDLILNAMNGIILSADSLIEKDPELILNGDEENKGLETE